MKRVIRYFEVTVTDAEGNEISREIYPGESIFESSAVFEHEQGSSYPLGTIVTFKPIFVNQK
ncbi:MULTISPECIES: hypothetical protein [unclassified Paenibacillus]|uniref:hypothetical protein n=1 Tax=unclassified Paenibacillus TaxID=185978 RepID=UPI003629639F